MAAVFALVLVPMVFAMMALLHTGNAVTAGVVMAAITLVMLAGGTFVGLFRLAQGWENESPH